MSDMTGSSSVSGSGSRAGAYWLDPRGQFAYLRGEWRLMFGRGTIVPDLLAGIAVALVALPLSLAIARASGVNPEVGLVTAIIGGMAVALFGGCRLQVSGPAAAMTFLVSEVVAKYGLPGLMAATLMAALFQIAAGVFRLGRFIQLIPRPVVAGFLSGIGLTIVCTQLPVILGYDVSHDEEGGALALLWETLRQLQRTEPTALAVGLSAVVLMRVLPRVSRKLPAPLIAVAAASALPIALGWSRVALLGELPSLFVAPRLPAVPWQLWNELVMAALAIFLLASLESLLSASVVDSLSRGPRADNDQELIGQGIGNVASALFGGIPVTGVIARSATNIQAGAQTRLASIAHTLILLVMTIFLAPLVARIPLAALAGVLVAVALRMIEVHLFRTLWRGSRPEAIIFLVTTGAILLTDLIVGVPVGMICAFLYVVYEMSHITLRPLPLDTAAPDRADMSCPAVLVMRVEGPLFFASGFHLRSLLSRLSGHRRLVLDLEPVPFLDVTGAEILDEAVDLLQRRGTDVLLARPSEAVAKRLRDLSQGPASALRRCPVYGDLRDAMLHAASEIGADDLCRECRGAGRCAALEGAMRTIEQLDQTLVPRVRAVITRGDDHGGRKVGVDQAARGESTPLGALSAEMIRPSPHTSWNGRAARPAIDPSAFIDPMATVIGEVTIGARVYIGPGVSIRADEGTPFFIGAESNIQDGVTLHALKGKVVLVHGRPYAIHVGRNVCLTHHALIHGPCYVGDRCFIGFKATVHDAIVGEGCVLGLGAVVVGVTLPPGRYVGHNVVVDAQETADALPAVDPRWEQLRDEVVEVNQELAAGHLQSQRANGELVVSGDERPEDRYA